MRDLIVIRQGLQEKCCKAEQDCFEALGTGCDRLSKLRSNTTTVQQNVQITYILYKVVTNIIQKSKSHNYLF